MVTDTVDVERVVAGGRSGAKVPTALCVAESVSVPLDLLTRFDQIVSEPIGDCLCLRPREKLAASDDKFTHRVPVTFRNGTMRMQKRWKGEMMFDDLEITSPLLPPDPSFRPIRTAK